MVVLRGVGGAIAYYKVFLVSIIIGGSLWLTYSMLNQIE